MRKVDGTSMPDSRPKRIEGLGTKVWVCSECGDIHDRDTNASKNIRLRVSRFSCWSSHLRNIVRHAKVFVATVSRIERRGADSAAPVPDPVVGYVFQHT